MLEWSLQEQLRLADKEGRNIPDRARALAKTWALSRGKGEARKGGIALWAARDNIQKRKRRWFPARKQRGWGSPCAWPRHWGWGPDFPRLFVCRLHFSWTESKFLCFHKEHHSFQRKEKTDFLVQGLSLRNVLMATGQERVPPSAHSENNRATGWSLLQYLQENGTSKSFPRRFLNISNMSCWFCPNPTLLLEVPRIPHAVWKVCALAGAATYTDSPSSSSL